MASDDVKAKLWTVLHIAGIEKVQEHKYTAPARLIDHKAFYSDDAS